MIEGNKTIIRPLEAGDEVYLHTWWNEGEMMAHATHCFGTLQSKEALRKSIEQDLEEPKLFPTAKRFLICEKNSLRPIGEISYHGWDARNQKAELGIKIAEISEQNKGYGKDALYHFVDFMFRFLNLNKIELTTMADNKRAQKLYEKMGFKSIGRIREAYFDSRIGRFSDVIYMDLLKQEWEQCKNHFIF